MLAIQPTWMLHVTAISSRTIKYLCLWVMMNTGLPNKEQMWKQLVMRVYILLSSAATRSIGKQDGKTVLLLQAIHTGPWSATKKDRWVKQYAATNAIPILHGQDYGEMVVLILMVAPVFLKMH